MTNHDELVRRLRDDSARWADGDKVMCNKAADAITKLQARAAELEAERVRLVKSAREAWDERAKAQTFATNCRNRAERAEADLAAARALLGEVTIRLGDNDDEMESLLRRIADLLAGKDAT